MSATLIDMSTPFYDKWDEDRRGQWVSVADEVPPGHSRKGGGYAPLLLFTTIDGNVTVGWVLDYTLYLLDADGTEDFVEYETGNGLEQYVVAWMPLPKAYKGGDSK